MGEYSVEKDILLANLRLASDGLPRAGSVVIQERLGKGGVGSVYLGFDEKLEAQVAVKVLHFEMAENRSVVERFLREARSTFKVDHPNVVRVVAVDEEAGTHYIVMEFVDGEAADERMRREGPLPERDALEIAVQTGDALAAAHEEGILHRDVKPANIMIRARDGRVKLTDLGLAKALGKESEGITGLTATGQMLGTPAYMSPEQARDAASTDERADVYSLGATLYALLTGKPPFEATQLFDLLQKVMRREPVDIRSLRPQLTQATAIVTKKLMDKAPAQRPQNMPKVVALLRECLKRAPAQGARGLARPEMVRSRTPEAAERSPEPALFERTPTPALPSRRARVTEPLGRSPVREQTPTPALPPRPSATGPPVEERTPTPALSPQETIPDRAGWQKLAGERRARPTVGLAPAPAPAPAPARARAPARMSARKKLTILLGAFAALVSIGGAAAFISSTNGSHPAGTDVPLAERAEAYKRWMDEGLRLRRAGKLREAAEAYKTAAKYALSGSRKAAEAAGERYKAQAADAEARGDIKRAIELYETALAMKDDPSTHQSLEAAKKALGEARTGKERKEKAAHWLMSAREAEEVGDYKSALGYYREAARLGADVASKVALLERELGVEPSGASGTGSPEEVTHPRDLTVDIGGGIRMRMVYISPGRFMMGSNGDDADERPAHEVVIGKGFYIGKYEVTQEQYEYVMGTNPSSFKRSNKPVEQVSWKDAVQFCKKVAARTGKPFRLPTEAEWEYAARAGSSDKYCFGDEEARLGDYAWYSSNSGKETHLIGRRRRNAWGLYDVHGNVAEWCSDWYGAGYYAGSPREDPAGPKAGKARVLRGGSWSLDSDHCRLANRHMFSPKAGFHAFGFRVAFTP